jgi:anti-anti-sigma factor
VPEELEIWIHGDEHHTVVRLRGRMDDTSASFAGRVVRELVTDPNGATDIEVHLEEVSSYDQAAAGVLLKMDAEASRADRRILLFGLPTYLSVLLACARC